LTLHQKSKTHDSEKLLNLVQKRLKNAQETHRSAEKKTNELLGVLERAQAFVTQGDAPVTMRPGKMHSELEKSGPDPNFVQDQ